VKDEKLYPKAKARKNEKQIVQEVLAFLRKIQG